MQEQNDRLLQQLSSKDEANFKLMSDRINANQKQVLLSAQIDELEKQVRHILIDEGFFQQHFSIAIFRFKFKNIKWRRL